MASVAPLSAPSPPPSGLRLRPAMRLRTRAEFDRVMKQGRRVSNDHLTVWALHNPLSFCRLGLIVGRRHGGATKRNRIKRLIREAFRQGAPSWPGALDLVVSPIAGAELTLATVRAAMERAVARVPRRSAPA